MKVGKKTIIMVIVICCLPVLAGCTASDSRVFQGTCISYEAKPGELVLENDEPELNPVEESVHQVTFDTSSAEVGLTPSPGDKIRVSYQVEGGRFIASKVMNVTKQDLMAQ